MLCRARECRFLRNFQALPAYRSAKTDAYTSSRAAINAILEFSSGALILTSKSGDMRRIAQGGDRSSALQRRAFLSYSLATWWRTLSDSAPVSRFAMLAEACASPSISPIQLVLTWVRCKRSAMTSAVISILLTVLRSKFHIHFDQVSCDAIRPAL